MIAAKDGNESMGVVAISNKAQASGNGLPFEPCDKYDFKPRKKMDLICRQTRVGALLRRTQLQALLGRTLALAGGTVCSY